MASGKSTSYFLDKSQSSMKEACHSEAQKGIVRFKSTHGILCDACSARLQKLRMNLEFFRQENSRLISKLHSVVGCKKFAESAGVPPDEAMALAGFHSLSSSSDLRAAAAMRSLLPEAFHNHEDSHLAVVSFTLKEQIASTEKEWKILAGRYNELVEEIQQSEKTLADVRNRNFQLESINAKLLSMMLYKQRSSQLLLNQAIGDQASLTKSVAQVPAERMYGKSPAIRKSSVCPSPIGTFEQKFGIACRGNNSGPFYSSPVSVLGESFDNELFEDSIGVAYKSPAYTLKGRTCSIENEEDKSMFGHAGDASAVESHSRMPLGDLQCFNSEGMVSTRHLGSIFDACLCLSEKEGCNHSSPRTSSTQSSSSKS